jgi:hypothetical protein
MHAQLRSRNLIFLRKLFLKFLYTAYLAGYEWILYQSAKAMCKCQFNVFLCREGTLTE